MCEYASLPATQAHGVYSIIATPGRLLHLTIEMNLQFSAVQLVIFDEADR